MRRALLRSAKPIPQTYSVGNVVSFRRDQQGRATWSPASRVIGHEGNENQNVWVLCENVPVQVSAQNIRPPADAEALAHAILHGHSILAEGIVRGQQELEDATAVPPKDSTAPVGGSLSTRGLVEAPQEDGGRILSILEDEVYNAAGRFSFSRRVSVAEPEAERAPTTRPSTRDGTDDLPQQITEHFTRVRGGETPGKSHAQASIVVRSRSKFLAFVANRVLTTEQVKHLPELKPGSLDYRKESPTVQSYIDDSRKKTWKQYEDFQAAIPLKGRELSDLLEARHVPVPLSGWIQLRTSKKSIRPTLYLSSSRD